MRTTVLLGLFLSNALSHFNKVENVQLAVAVHISGGGEAILVEDTAAA